MALKQRELLFYAVIFQAINIFYYYHSLCYNLLLITTNKLNTETRQAMNSKKDWSNLNEIKSHLLGKSFCCMDSEFESRAFSTSFSSEDLCQRWSTLWLTEHYFFIPGFAVGFQFPLYSTDNINQDNWTSNQIIRLHFLSHRSSFSCEV